MIQVTRLDGSKFILNSELIELIESNPDTVISLTTHRKFVVKESSEDLMERIVAYKRKIYPFAALPGQEE